MSAPSIRLVSAPGAEGRRRSRRCVARREPFDSGKTAFHASLAVADPSQGDLLVRGVATAGEPAPMEAAEFPQPAMALDIVPEAGDLWSAETGERLAPLRMFPDAASEGGGRLRG